MKIILLIVCIILCLLTVAIVLKINELKNIKYIQPEILLNKKILIVYFSNGGNTKNIANNLHSIVSGDIIEIQLIEKYPNNIFKMSKLIRKQIKENYLPQIENIDISSYDIVFVGSPIWAFSLSLPLKSFLKNNNFENKTLIPFFTCSGGVSKNKVMNEIQNITNAKEIKKPLFMFETGLFLVKEQITRWLNNI